MDIFRYHTDPSTPTKLEHGEIINGAKSKTWVERYREPGEFEIVADVSSGMREKLPIGSMISHLDTDEIMIVENHSMSEDRGEPSDITISGRSFETILEQRVVGANKYFPNSGTIADYVLTANYTWIQAVSLIHDHIDATALIDDYDALPFVVVMHDITGVGTSNDQSIARGDLYSRLIQLLGVDNLGIRAIRPWKTVPSGSPSGNITLVIHKGIDKTKEVLISHDSGEIESADYLWSNKLSKNSAVVSGRWVEVRVDDLINVEYGRRTMYVEAKDIDEQFNDVPTGTDLYNVIVKMEQRGKAAIAAQRNIALTKTEVSKEGTRAIYRRDFNVGDLITVHGDYQETTSRRVTEYVEIEDETGMTSYPTLAVDD